MHKSVVNNEDRPVDQAETDGGRCWKQCTLSGLLILHLIMILCRKMWMRTVENDIQRGRAGGAKVWLHYCRKGCRKQQPRQGMPISKDDLACICIPGKSHEAGIRVMSGEDQNDERKHPTSIDHGCENDTTQDQLFPCWTMFGRGTTNVQGQ